jgi:erythromycin esterase
MNPAYVLIGLAAAGAAGPARLVPGKPIATPLGPGQSADAILALRAGESADLAVLQHGIDVVVEAYGPDGKLLDSVDSPNGREGDEPVSLFATKGGRYRLHVKPISASEPAGKVTFRVVALRNVAQTRQLLERRRHARLEAAGWLRRNDSPLPPTRLVAKAPSLPPFDDMAANARVIGLGEATHGSREFNDLRLALVQRLVERHGYRLIALEDNSSRWRALEPFVTGEAASAPVPLEWGWIGRRTRRELLMWVRGWNVSHPHDRVGIVGVDPQDNALSRDILGRFIGKAYGANASAEWAKWLPELQAADEQTDVFGDSGVGAGLREFAIALAGQIANDAPLLRPRFGERAYREALAAAKDVAAFADFNAGSSATSHSRDWYMALAVVRAIDEADGHPKAVYWAHNAHISAAQTRWGPTGALLRQTFGCGYRAVATTFGQGGFSAQIPNDPADRLAANTVPAAAEESIEGVLSLVAPGSHMAAWPCGAPDPALAPWLNEARPLRWVGGLYAPSTAPSGSFQPYRLAAAFDAIAYLPSVSAEDIPRDRPLIPPRKRTPSG